MCMRQKLVFSRVQYLCIKKRNQIKKRGNTRVSELEIFVASFKSKKSSCDFKHSKIKLQIFMLVRLICKIHLTLQDYSTICEVDITV